MLEEILTIETMKQFSVLVILVGIIMQFTKGFFDWFFKKLFKKKISTEKNSYIIAVILLFFISISEGEFVDKTFIEVFTVSFMNTINGIIIALASNKAYENIRRNNKTHSQINS